MKFNIQIECKIEASSFKEAERKIKKFMNSFEKLQEEYSLILENEEDD